MDQGGPGTSGWPEGGEKRPERDPGWHAVAWDVVFEPPECWWKPQSKACEEPEGSES